MSYSYFKLYKPYRVLSQFSKDSVDQLCLKDILNVESNVYPVGRLDYDSEGLLILTNDSTLNHELLNPKKKTNKVYYAQVEGLITDESIRTLSEGVVITLPVKKGARSKNKNFKRTIIEKYQTLPCEVYRIPEPELPERIPPIRVRENIPTSWISMFLVEGKNHQVRKMCANVGFPVLRLVRYAIGQITIKDMKSGDLIEISRDEIIMSKH